jgi:hypothetical protein
MTKPPTVTISLTPTEAAALLEALAITRAITRHAQWDVDKPRVKLLAWDRIAHKLVSARKGTTDA